MTNFFGSVMETIHTDSTYKALSIKSFSRAEIKMPPDQPANDNERRILADSNGQDQTTNPKKEVTFYIPSLLVVQKALFLYNIVVMGRNECCRNNRVLSDICGILLMTRWKKLKMSIPLCNTGC